MVTRTVSNASVLRRESRGVTGAVTRPPGSVPAGETLLAASVTPARPDITIILTASVRIDEKFFREKSCYFDDLS